MLICYYALRNGYRGQHSIRIGHALGLSANRLAKAIGVPTNRITEIVNGTGGITGETAVLLRQAFCTTGVLAEFAVSLRIRPGKKPTAAGGDSAC